MQIPLNFFYIKGKVCITLSCEKNLIILPWIDIANTRRIPRGISELSIHVRRSSIQCIRSWRIRDCNANKKKITKYLLSIL